MHVAKKHSYTQLYTIRDAPEKLNTTIAGDWMWSSNQFSCNLKSVQLDPSYSDLSWAEIDWESFPTASKYIFKYRQETSIRAFLVPIY